MKNTYLLFLPLYYATTNTMLKQTKKLFQPVYNAVKQPLKNVLSNSFCSTSQKLTVEKALNILKISGNDASYAQINKAHKEEIINLAILDIDNDEKFKMLDQINSAKEFLRKYNNEKFKNSEFIYQLKNPQDLDNLFKNSLFLDTFSKLSANDKLLFWETVLKKNDTEYNFKGFYHYYRPDEYSDSFFIYKDSIRPKIDQLEGIFNYNTLSKEYKWGYWVYYNIMESLDRLQSSFDPDAFYFILNSIENENVKKIVKLKKLLIEMEYTYIRHQFEDVSLLNILNNSDLSEILQNGLINLLFTRFQNHSFYFKSQIANDLKYIVDIIQSKGRITSDFLKAMHKSEQYLKTKIMNNFFQENKVNVKYYLNFIDYFDKQTKKFSWFSKVPSWDNEEDVMKAFKKYQETYPQK